MKILVCGGRKFDRRDFLYETLDRYHCKWLITEIIHGGAGFRQTRKRRDNGQEYAVTYGADLLAEDWAHMRGVKVRAFLAEWDKYGAAAGPIRNQQMLAEGKPNVVFAFPGGRGTLDMIRQTRAAAVMLKRIGWAHDLEADDEEASNAEHRGEHPHPAATGGGGAASEHHAARSMGQPVPHRTGRAARGNNRKIQGVAMDKNKTRQRRHKPAKPRKPRRR